MEIKQQIEILKDFEKNFEIYFNNGICETFSLYYYKSDFCKNVSLGDFWDVRKYIKNKLPPPQKNQYSWTKGIIKPRKEFLKQLIYNLENF